MKCSPGTIGNSPKVRFVLLCYFLQSSYKWNNFHAYRLIKNKKKGKTVEKRQCGSISSVGYIKIKMKAWKK